MSWKKGVRFCVVTAALTAALFLSAAFAYAGTDSVTILMTQADDAFNAGNPGRAADLYEQCYAEIMAAPAQFPKKLAATIVTNIADCRTAAGSRALARQWWQRLIEAYPDSPVRCGYAKYRIGQSYIDEGLALPGETALQKVADDHPTVTDTCALALRIKAESQFNRQSYTDTELTCRNLIARYPNSKNTDVGHAKQLLARAIMAQGRRRADDAIVAFLTLPASRENSREDLAMTYLSVGACYADYKKDNANAEVWFTKVVDDYSDTRYCQEARFNRAVCRIHLANHYPAMQDINAITVKHLEEYARGLYYESEGDYANAVAHFAQVGPSYSVTGSGWPTTEPRSALMELGYCYTSLNEFTKATQAYAESRALYPQVPLLDMDKYYCAAAYIGMGQEENARELLQQLIDDPTPNCPHPSMFEVKFYLAQCSYLEQNWAQAQASFVALFDERSKAGDLTPDQAAMLRYDIGICCQLQGNLTGAVEAYNYVIRECPQSPFVELAKHAAEIAAKGEPVVPVIPIKGIGTEYVPSPQQ